MTIVGVTFDGPIPNHEWVEEQGFQYEIWMDIERTLAVTYRAIDDLDQPRPYRITVMLDAEGDLVLGYYGGVDVGTHPQQVLEDAQILFGP